MERSLRFNTLFFYRTPTLLFLLFLFPVLAQATESVYEQQIQQARNGNYTPFLDYLQRNPGEIKKRGSQPWRSGKRRVALRRITTIIVSVI